MLVLKDAVAVQMALDRERNIDHMVTALELLFSLLLQLEPLRNDSDQIGTNTSLAELLD